MQDVTAVILCGGAGQRLGGDDKPLVEHNGRPLIEFILEELEPVCAHVLISANRNLDVYQHYGQVITDGDADRGPLEGIACCLERLPTPWAFVCPGDAPFVTAEILRRLYTSLANTELRMAIAHDGQRRQHLHVLLGAEFGPSIREYLLAGHHSVYGWQQDQDAIEVAMPDLAAAFVDLDEPGDLD
jgi:molybdopterin-guanine dinucleotide biosynthesis protein A